MTLSLSGLGACRGPEVPLSPPWSGLNINARSGDRVRWPLLPRDPPFMVITYAFAC